MKFARNRHAPTVIDHGVYGIDRMVRNVETGRFERSLAGADRGGVRS